MISTLRWTARRCSAAATALSAALLLASCAGETSASGASGSAPSMSTAPVSTRIDLVEPTFANPTAITNPLFPIIELTQVIRVGSDGDGPLREEFTLLPGTKVIEWNGQQIEVVTSQFMAYSGRRVVEVAVDHFAQADDGAVWFFGADVTVYEDGVVESHEGTWLAGKDGPPGMIMPASPHVGDVYRPENIPGLVFEEVVVTSTDWTVAGPGAPIAGCLLIEERPMDGAVETKSFAPGYAEFEAVVESEDEVVTVSVGLPTDALGGGMPTELDTIATEANLLLRPISNWHVIAASVAWASAAWESYRSAAVPLTAEQVDRALEGLRAGVAAQDPAATHLAATDLAFAATDLRLRYATPAAMDLERMSILAERLLVDAADGAAGPVSGDVAALQAIWFRVRHTVAAPSRVDAVLADMADAVEDEDLTSAASAAEQLGSALAQL